VSDEPEARAPSLPGPLFSAVDEAGADTPSAVKGVDEEAGAAGKVTEALRDRDGKSLGRGASWMTARKPRTSLPLTARRTSRSGLRT